MPSHRIQSPGTATGEHLCAGAEDEALCWCQLRTQCFPEITQIPSEKNEEMQIIGITKITIII